MEKNECLNALFVEWRFAVGQEGNRFIADGIIHEPSYRAASTQILFLGKEPNEPSEVASWDFREEWAKDPDWKHAVQAKRWAFGILNGFPAWEQAQSPPVNTLLQVACMNVKKTGGNGSSKYEDIVHHVQAHGNLLRKQVEIIAPRIIIGGLRGYELWSTLVGSEVRMEMAEGVGIFRWGQAKVIDFFHPSNRFPQSMSYALLSRVVSSAKFQAL